MLGNFVVLNDNGVFFLFDMGLEVGVVGEMVVEEFEEDVGFFFFEVDDVMGDWI